MTKKVPLTDRAGVEKAVAALQEKLAEGDPADEALKAECEAELENLRSAYRASPAAFTKETIEALRDLKDLLAG